MATRSSILAWRIPGTEELGGLPSMGSQSRTRLKRLSSSSSRESGEEVRSALLAPGGSTELPPRPRPRGDLFPRRVVVTVAQSGLVAAAFSPQGGCSSPVG